MNSTQLHYREATRALEAAADCGHNHQDAAHFLAEAQTHALLACTAALAELTRQADPQLEAVAATVGVLRPAADNVIRHTAFNAFGADT